MIMDRLYGGVCYAGIDTDPELKYPKVYLFRNYNIWRCNECGFPLLQGAGRVAFSNQQSYIAAISARFVQLQHGDIDKRVEVKPYVLDDQMCDECQGQRCGGKFAPYFCANVTCLQVSVWWRSKEMWTFKMELIVFVSCLVSRCSVLLRTLLDDNSFTAGTWISQTVGEGGRRSATCRAISLVLTPTVTTAAAARRATIIIYISRRTTTVLAAAASTIAAISVSLPIFCSTAIQQPPAISTAPIVVVVDVSLVEYINSSFFLFKFFLCNLQICP